MKYKNLFIAFIVFAITVTNGFIQYEFGRQAGHRDGMIEGLDSVATVAAENPRLPARAIGELAQTEADLWRSGAASE